MPNTLNDHLLKLHQQFAALKDRVSALETIEGSGGLYCSQRLLEFSSTTVQAVGAVRSTSQISIAYISLVAAVYTTNDVSNYYDILVRSYDPDYTNFTNITASFSTSGWGVTTWAERAPAVTVASPTRYGIFALSVTKNSSPGTLYALVNVYHRIAGL